MACLLLGTQPSHAADTIAFEPGFIEREEARIARLFAQLDLNRPGWADIHEAVEDKKWDRAGALLLKHYRDRNPPSLESSLDPQDSPPIAIAISRAEAVLEDTFTIQGVTARQPRTAKRGLDWRHRGPRDDKEWAWLLNRHRYFRELLDAYRETGRIEFVDAIDAHLRDWIVSNPYPGRLTFSEPWRALEAARRMLDSWPYVWETLRDEPRFSPETRLLMLASIADHGDALRHYASFWGGNHLLTEKAALAVVAVVWPEFRKSEAWLDYAIRRTEKEIFDQTYPDGAYKELTNHYQRVVAVNAQRFLDILAHNNVPVSEGLRARVEQMWNYSAYVMRPDGTGPLNSASDLEYNRGFVKAVKRFYDREDWVYIALNGNAGILPADPPTRYFPWAGHAVMRDGWSASAQWAFFDIGPHGTGHQHDDRLHLSITLGGQDLLTDSGRYTYQPGPWRTYFTGPESHNLLFHNGRAPEPPPLEARERPLPVIAEVNESHDYFSADARFPSDPATGSGPVHYRRGVLYRRGEFWLVSDYVRHFGPASITVLWNFHPKVRVTHDERGLLAHANGHPRLRIVPLEPSRWNAELIRGREKPHPMGWYSADFNIREPAYTARLETESRRPERFLWLLLPVDRSDQGPIDFTREATPDGGDRVRLRWSDRSEDRIRFAPDGTATFQHIPAPEAAMER